MAVPRFSYESTLVLTAGAVGQTRPVAVTCDPVQGEVCVTDLRQTTLHILNSHDIELFRTATVARLSYPADGSVDVQGRLVCVDRAATGLTTITRLNVYGEPDAYAPESPAAGWSPRHLIVARDGNYLTLDPASALLAKHDCDSGRLLWSRTVAQPRGEDLFLGRPCQGPDGRIYVPGGNLRQVLILDAEGRYESSFGEFGSAEGYLSFPVAVATAPDGRLLVLDRMRHKILVFGQDQRFVTEFGSMGAAPGQFYHPVALAADAGGRIYVAQGFQGRVQVFRYAEASRPGQ